VSLLRENNREKLPGDIVKPGCRYNPCCSGALPDWRGFLFKLTTMKRHLLLQSFILVIATAIAQNPTSNKGMFKVYEPGYYQNSILKGIEKYENAQTPVKQEATFKLDPKGIFIPTDKSYFKTSWHQQPVSQGNTAGRRLNSPKCLPFTANILNGRNNLCGPGVKLRLGKALK
jgi:hypothetical protein